MFSTPSVRDKLKQIEALVHAALLSDKPEEVPKFPARDIRTVSIGELRGKPALNSREGQARLLHDLANIELQAMELAHRTLVEFPEAPRDFREELGALVLSESKHLTLCLNGIEDLGFRWGDWPVHIALWTAVEKSDSLLDRLIIVHRYLEGSGLDAGHKISQKLSTFESQIKPILNTIVTEELDHVRFGSRWFKKFCEEQKLNADETFRTRLSAAMYRVPRRLEPIYRPIRKQAGFTEGELEYLETLQFRRDRQ